MVDDEERTALVAQAVDAFMPVVRRLVDEALGPIAAQVRLLKESAGLRGIRENGHDARRRSP